MGKCGQRSRPDSGPSSMVSELGYSRTSPHSGSRPRPGLKGRNNLFGQAMRVGRILARLGFQAKAQAVFRDNCRFELLRVTVTVVPHAACSFLTKGNYRLCYGPRVMVSTLEGSYTALFLSNHGSIFKWRICCDFLGQSMNTGIRLESDPLNTKGEGCHKANIKAQ